MLLRKITDWGFGLRSLVLCGIGAVVLVIFGLDKK